MNFPFKACVNNQHFKNAYHVLYTELSTSHTLYFNITTTLMI